VNFDFTFPRNYEVRLLQAAPPVHPLEKLFHFPVELEEGDRAGVYLRVEPRQGLAWTGFFAEGFESEHAISAICSCPDPDFVCVVAGGYAYLVEADDPSRWFRIEQRPVTALRVLSQPRLILFSGFTTITALGDSGIRWTTERLSWEGISITRIEQDTLYGHGWDAIADQEVAFEVDVKTGKHSGGTRPKQD
jgi:hypothetical protein